MTKQRKYQKKTAAPARSQPTKTSVKSPVHPVEELQAAIGNREMGRLMETNRLPHPSSPFPKLQGELPLLGGMMPVSQGTIQRQPLFRGLSQELAADTATLALPATGAVIQPKLTLGTPGDMYEEEADRVARQVVDEIHSSPFREPNTQSLGERKPDGGEALRVQRQITVRAAGDAGGELSSEWEGELQRATSGGQPLSPSVKEPMERAFGADFGGVRVHTGAQADRLARSIQAKAFTTGHDVFFRQGAYEPGSRGGQELIAHELTHVVQQNKEEKRGKKEKANQGQKEMKEGSRGKRENLRLERSEGKGVQACKQDENDYTKVHSSFNENMVISGGYDHERQRHTFNGGAITVFVKGGGLFGHRLVCLEWIDGDSGMGKERIMHLRTPALAGRAWGGVPSMAKQIASLVPMPKSWRMESYVDEFKPDDINEYANRNVSRRRTAYISREAFKGKYDLLESEKGKKYSYDIYAPLGWLSDGKNCYDWANKVASEAII